MLEHEARVTRDENSFRETQGEVTRLDNLRIACAPSIDVSRQREHKEKAILEPEALEALTPSQKKSLGTFLMYSKAGHLLMMEGLEFSQTEWVAPITQPGQSALCGEILNKHFVHSEDYVDAILDLGDSVFCKPQYDGDGVGIFHLHHAANEEYVVRTNDRFFADLVYRPSRGLKLMPQGPLESLKAAAFYPSFMYSVLIPGAFTKLRTITSPRLEHVYRDRAELARLFAWYMHFRAASLAEREIPSLRPNGKRVEVRLIASNVNDSPTVLAGYGKIPGAEQILGNLGLGGHSESLEQTMLRVGKMLDGENFDALQESQKLYARAETALKMFFERSVEVAQALSIDAFSFKKSFPFLRGYFALDLLPIRSETGGLDWCFLEINRQCPGISGLKKTNPKLFWQLIPYHYGRSLGFETISGLPDSVLKQKSF